MFDPILSGKRILIVDDCREVTDLLLELYADWGAAVDCAASVAGARRKLQRCAYDLVVADLHNHGLLGADLTRPIVGPSPTPPAVVFLTAERTGPWPASHVARQLGLPVLFKPFNLDELLRVSRLSIARRSRACA